MSPASSCFQPHADGCGSSPSLFMDDNRPSCFAPHGEHEHSGAGCSHGLQRRPRMPLKQRKGYFDSAEYYMAKEMGQAVEALPPVDRLPLARSASQERRRSRLSQCTYAHETPASDALSGAENLDPSSH